MKKIKIIEMTLIFSMKNHDLYAKLQGINW